MQQFFSDKDSTNNKNKTLGIDQMENKSEYIWSQREQNIFAKIQIIFVVIFFLLVNFNEMCFQIAFV